MRKYSLKRLEKITRKKYWYFELEYNLQLKGCFRLLIWKLLKGNDITLIYSGGSYFKLRDAIKEVLDSDECKR